MYFAEQLSVVRHSMLENEHQLELFDYANSRNTLTAAGVVLAAKSNVVRDAMGEAGRAIEASERRVSIH